MWRHDELPGRAVPDLLAGLVEWSCADAVWRPAMTSGPMEGDNFRAGSRIPAGVVLGEGDAPAGISDWRDFAVCRETDPEAFFPEKNDNRFTNIAIRVCNSCPVKQQCLDFALDNGIDYGIWGGLGADARKKLRRTSKKRIDVDARRRWVKRLTDAGCTPKEIASELDMTERQVFRDKQWLNKQAAA